MEFLWLDQLRGASATSAKRNMYKNNLHFICGKRVHIVHGFCREKNINTIDSAHLGRG